MYRVFEIEPFRPEINARNELNNMAIFFPIYYYPLGFPLGKIIIKLPKFCKIRRKILFELHSTQLLKTMSIPKSHTQCHDITVYFFLKKGLNSHTEFFSKNIHLGKKLFIYY